MSKAFTRESDTESSEPIALPRRHIPPGIKNYITAAGAKRLQEELARLMETKRQTTAMAAEAAGAAVDTRLLTRIRQIQEILQSVVIADLPSDRNRVGFGATVKVRDARGEETIYRIVGLDETEPENDRISWLSPLAKQLLSKQLGERVKFKTPAGEQELQILEINYDQ